MSDMTGSASYITFKGTAITPDFREWKESEQMNVVDASAGADADKTWLTTLMEGEASFKGLYQGGTSATDIYNLCVKGASGTLVIGIEGTASGKPKKTINTAIVTKRERTVKYDDVVELAIDFKFSAAVTDGTF